MDGNLDLYELLMKNKPLDKHKTLAVLHKLISYCRWADNGGSGSSNSSQSQPINLLSFNFKQWLVTLANDCFYYFLHQGEVLGAL